MKLSIPNNPYCRTNTLTELITFTGLSCCLQPTHDFIKFIL